MIGANVVTFVLAGYILFRMLDNEFFHPQLQLDASLVEPPLLPPAMALAPPPGAPKEPHARSLLADVRGTALWRALAAV